MLLCNNNYMKMVFGKFSHYVSSFYFLHKEMGFCVFFFFQVFLSKSPQLDVRASYRNNCFNVDRCCDVIHVISWTLNIMQLPKKKLTCLIPTIFELFKLLQALFGMHLLNLIVTTDENQIQREKKLWKRVKRHHITFWIEWQT